MSEHAREIARFTDLNAKVIGVSTDQVPTLAQFAEHCGATGKVLLLSDARHQAIERFGVAIPSGPTLNQRATFIIDADGVVRYAFVEEKTSNYQGVEPELAALREIVG